MSEYQCGEDRFLSDVEGHQLTVIRDDGVNRHIRLSRPSSSGYRFDLVTWAGILVITGDCGTWVFSRVEDMFGFFRMDRSDFNFNRKGGLSINPGYWSEKLLAVDKSGRRGGDAEEFSEELFRKEIKEWFDGHEFDSQEQADDCWSDIESEVLAPAEGGDESQAMHAAYIFSHESGFNFADFYEVNCRVYTWHFIWCLYAIVWGIRAYDVHHSAKALTDSVMAVIGAEVAA